MKSLMKEKIAAFLALFVLWLCICVPEGRAAYYGSKTSDKYHKKTCPYYSHIKPSKRIAFETPKQALASGYLPCPVCRPPKSGVIESGTPSGVVGGAGAPTVPLPGADDERTKERMTAQETSGDLKDSDRSVTVQVIKFEKGEDGMERVAVHLDRFSLPEIRVLEGKEPTIELGFRNARTATDRVPDLETEGKFVRRISVQKQDAARGLTIVLEMAPNTMFFVNPFFYEAENVYLLEITKLKKTYSP